MKNIMVCALSRSLSMIGKENIKLAKDKLESLDFNVNFSKNAKSKDAFISSSIEKRVLDFHNAIKDNKTDIVLSVLGGYNSNQLLKDLDYDLIKNNPKMICGYSDITVLLNAIYAKTKVITYLGPTFHSFGMKQGLEDTVKYFLKAVNKEPYYLQDPKYYSSDKWYDDQDNRTFIKNKGCIVINKGKATGTIIGGNLCSFNLLQGTEYMPSLKDKILFIEDDALVGVEFPYEFERNLVSLIQQKDFDKVKGIVFGRCQTQTKMNLSKWKKILDKKELNNIPIIINANFGHTTPNATIPIGGKCTIDTSKKDKMIYITI